MEAQTLVVFLVKLIQQINFTCLQRRYVILAVLHHILAIKHHFYVKVSALMDIMVKKQDKDYAINVILGVNYAMQQLQMLALNANLDIIYHLCPVFKIVHLVLFKTML
jgi:hypothetical protein